MLYMFFCYLNIVPSEYRDDLSTVSSCLIGFSSCVLIIEDLLNMYNVRNDLNRIDKL